jgi:hypothetical protein
LSNHNFYSVVTENAQTLVYTICETARFVVSGEGFQV